MGMYPTPPGDSLEPLVARLRKLESELRDLQRPTGTSLGSLVDQVQQALANITATVTTAIQTLSYTRAETDARIASPGAIAPTTVSASGAISATGAISTPAIGTLDGGVISADVKSRTLSVGYDSVYIDSSNRMGKSPSALRFKQDLALHDFDPSIIDRMQGYTFRLIEAVELMGDDAPVEVGYIADYLADIGANAFVRYDEDGQFSGLAYERIVMIAIDAIKELRAERQLEAVERAAMQADLDAIKAKLGL